MSTVKGSLRKPILTVAHLFLSNEDKLIEIWETLINHDFA